MNDSMIPRMMWNGNDATFCRKSPGVQTGSVPERASDLGIELAQAM